MAVAISYITQVASDSKSRLVAYIDTGVAGLPVTPNGGNIIIAWKASGTFAL